jgi:flagellar motor component MotA
MMRNQVQAKTVLPLLLGATLVAAAGALRSGWFSLGASPTTPPWMVIAGALIAAALSLVAAHRLRITPRIKAAYAQPRPADLLIDELAAFAEVARLQGLLILAADDRAKVHPLFTAGLHLLCEDSDRRLIRAALEGQAEAQAMKTASSRAIAIAACRVGLIAGALALITALALLAANSVRPWELGRPSALFVLAGAGAFAIATALATPVISLLRRHAAADEFGAAAIVEAIVSMQAKEDPATTRQRLQDLLPGSPAARRIPDQTRRAA